MFWFGVQVQTTIGSQCVYQVRSVSTLMHGHLIVLISDIEGDLAIHRTYHLPPGANITASGRHQQLTITPDK